MSKAEDVLKGMEKISREQMNDELSSSGGRTSDYAKIKKIARKTLEPGEGCLKRKGIKEDVVSAIRTQVYHLNDDDLDEHQEPKYDVTRTKMTDENDEDITNSQGEQLYKLYITQNPKKEAPEEVDNSVTSDQEQSALDQPDSQDTSENGESEQEYVKSEAEADFDELFGE